MLAKIFEFEGTTPKARSAVQNSRRLIGFKSTLQKRMRRIFHKPSSDCSENREANFKRYFRIDRLIERST